MNYCRDILAMNAGKHLTCSSRAAWRALDIAASSEPFRIGVTWESAALASSIRAASLRNCLPSRRGITAKKASTYASNRSLSAHGSHSAERSTLTTHPRTIRPRGEWDTQCASKSTSFAKLISGSAHNAAGLGLIPEPSQFAAKNRDHGALIFGGEGEDGRRD